MKAGWEVKPLGEVCRLELGSTPQRKNPKYWDNDRISGNVWLSIADMTAVNDKFIGDSKEYVSDDAAIKMKLVPRGTILLSFKLSLGRVAIASTELRTNEAIVSIHDLDTKILCRDYIYWYFTFYNWDKAAKNDEKLKGKTLNKAKLKVQPIIIPPLEEQKRIVAILDKAFESLDRAKQNAEANLQSAKELFEAGLLSVFSEIEKQSDQKLLKEIALDFGRGKSKHRPRNAPFLYDGPYPFVQTGDVRNSEHLITKYKQTYTDAGLAQSKLWPADTLCITIAANIAETAILSFDACFPDSIIGVVPNPKLTTSRYLEYLLQFFQKRLKARGEGAAQHNINLATFETEYFPFPSHSKQTAAITALDNVSAAVQLAETHYQAKLQDIADLRQSLLQKAFAGELT